MNIGSHTCLVLLEAGLKAVGESVQKQVLYWDVNLNGSSLLVEAMGRHGCRTLVFSSTALTISGLPKGEYRSRIEAT